MMRTLTRASIPLNQAKARVAERRERLGTEPGAYAPYAEEIILDTRSGLVVIRDAGNGDES